MQFSPQGGNGTVFALRGEPNRSPAERVRFGKEEGANIVQFSPRGGNGTVFAPSDVVPVTGIEPVRLSSRDFKSRASANFAMAANIKLRKEPETVYHSFPQNASKK